ncbi:MAG: hypothetical protein JST54_15310 [Deltaproteobacteria bacterium]|nr:hypothetical protein [Deltaproteobacteria bacterium]
MVASWILCAMLAATPHRPKVAVLAFHDVDGKDAHAAELLTQVASAEVVKFNKFDVVTPQVIADLLGVERQRQLLGCSESSCLAEIGNALGADYLLSGQLGRLGDQYRIDLTLVDARRSQVLAQQGGFEKDLGALGPVVSRDVHALFVGAQLVEAAPTEAVAASTAAPEEPGTSRTPAYVVLGIAGALTAAAAVSTGLAIKKYGDLTPSSSDADRSSQLNLARAADGLWAGALIAGGIGGYLYFSAAPASAGAGGEVTVGGRF